MSAPIDISEALCSADVISWSEDYKIAVATTKCVYLMTLKCDPSNLHNAFIFDKACLQAPAEKLKFDVGMDTKVLHDADYGVPSKLLQSLELDRTLSPDFVASPSYNVFKMVRWSPAGCDQQGRCIMACLTRDHRLTVYRVCRKKTRLIKIAELSSLFYNHISKRQYCIYPQDMPISPNGSNSLEFFTEYKRRLYVLSAIAMNWSGVFTSDSSTLSSTEAPAPKVPRQDMSTETRYCLLAVVMKSGDVVVWRFDLPVTDENSESSPRLLGVISTEDTNVISCAWYKPEVNDDKYGWLAIGSRDGIISIWKVDGNGSESAFAKKCIEVWSEKDELAVNQLAWGQMSSQTSQPLLVATKGIFIMAFLLDISDGDIRVVHQTHVSGKHAVSITGLDINCNVVVTCSLDGCAQKAVITSNNAGLQIDTELLEPLKPSQIRQCGVSISPGRTYVAIASELCRGSRNGDRTSKIYIKPLRSELEAEAHILSNDGPLSRKLDSLEFFRQTTVANYTLPSGLEDLAGDKFWKSTELENCRYKLQLRRYLLKMKEASVQFTISQRTRGRMNEVSPELQVLQSYTEEDIINTENQLTLLHTKEALQSWRTVEEDQPKNSDHPNVCSLLLMCDFIQTSDLQKEVATDETKNLVAELQAKYHSYGSVEGQRETCVLCKENIPFGSVNQSACSKGHQWKYSLEYRWVHEGMIVLNT